MELQVYEPGWVPQFDGFGCSATQWCANMTIDSFQQEMNTGQVNNDACNDLTLGGIEPINWAYVTKSGTAQAPANPVATNNNPAALVPDLNNVLLMNPGDTIRVTFRDTTAGERVDIDDLTTGGDGSMTASVGNGFGHLRWEPNGDTCHNAPYAFHPAYSSDERGNVWTAHTYNVSFADEIGHFEYCRKIDFNGGSCLVPGVNDNQVDEDDQLCLDGRLYPGAVPIIGCTLDDGDWDGPSYRLDWPGVFPNTKTEQRRIPTPVQFTTPASSGKPLEDLSFEADLPRIEVGEPGTPDPPCNRLTGEHCVNPPPGARFYPIYTLAQTSDLGCVYQQGGTHLPGTFETFGGTSATEYGDLLQVAYPGAGFAPFYRFNDFRRDIGASPCNGR